MYLITLILIFTSLSSSNIHRPLFCSQFINQSISHEHDANLGRPFDHLRDLIWTLTAASRKQLSLRLPIELKQKPSEDQSMNEAFNDTRSLKELKEIQSSWSRKEAAASRLIEAEVKRLIASHRLLPPSKWNWNEPDFKACFMGRLNPHIYEGAPLVSFMLQYFKRPSSIRPIVERLRLCHHPETLPGTH